MEEYAWKFHGRIRGYNKLLLKGSMSKDKMKAKAKFSMTRADGFKILFIQVGIHILYKLRSGVGTIKSFA